MSPLSLHLSQPIHCHTMSFTKPPSSPDDAPCSCCQEMVFSTSKAMNCNLCQAWFHISCVDISVDAYEMLKCMKGSVWLCEGCEETFSDMQSRLDSLSNENVVLSTKLKELEGLPLVVRTLQSQIAFISNDLNFILNGNGSESSKVDRNKAAPPPPPINISNRFSSLSRDCKETGPIVTDHARPVPLQYIAPAGSPLPDTPSATSLHATIVKSPSSPSKEGHPTKKSSNAHPTPDRMRHSSSNLPKHGRFYLRGVLKSTPTENVKAKLASFGLTAEQLNHYQK